MSTANRVRFELLGADELNKAFTSLTVAVRRSVLSKAVNKGGRVMVPPLRRATPVSKKGSKSPKATPSGTMRKSTGIVIRKYKGGALHAAYVGHVWPRGAAAHLVERGTQVRQAKRGANRGRLSPRPFFQPVYDQYRSQMEESVRAELAKGLDAATDKVALRALKKWVNRK